MNGQTDWVIPTITASASLLGAMVGGFATYWTSKKTHDRQTAAEEERQKSNLLREAAIRFVAAMTDISVAGLGATRMSHEWGPLAEQLVLARTDQELVEVARQLDPTIHAGLGRLSILIRLVRMSGLLEEDLKKAVTMLTELRLIAPGDVADSAQRVVYTAFAQEITAAIAPNRRHHTTEAFNREINDFVNQVRHHMKVEHHAFDTIDQRALQNLLRAQSDNGGTDADPTL